MGATRIDVDVEKAQELLKAGKSWRSVAKELGVSPRTLRRRLEEAKGKLRRLERLNGQGGAEALEEARKLREEIQALEGRLKSLGEALRKRWEGFDLEAFEALEPLPVEDGPVALYRSQAQEDPDGELKEALGALEAFMGRLERLRRMLAEERELTGDDALHTLYAKLVPALERKARDVLQGALRASSRHRWELGKRLAERLAEEVKRASKEPQWPVWRHLAALWLPRLSSSPPDLVLTTRPLTLALCLELGLTNSVEDALQRREPHTSLLSAALPKETARTLRHLRACEALERALKELTPRGLATRIVV